MLLALLNNLKIADQEVRQGFWKRETNRGREIKGKTVAIIGYGNMGTDFARRLKGFDVRVIAYDKYKMGFGNDEVEEVKMEEVFKEADILSLHVPLSEETHYLVDNEYINNFKKSIYLINTSRGKVVKTSDLLKALQQNIVEGAVLDVLEYEGTTFENLDNEQLPETFKQLASSEKVLLSPHIAGWTLDSHLKLAELLITKIKNIIVTNY